MKKLLMPILKYSKPLYSLYYYLGTGFLNFLKLFVKTNDRLILFNSFGGKKFDDSPKAVYDLIRQDPRFADYHLVWAFQCPEQFDVPKGQKIKTDTLFYFITALKARCWVTNSSIERGLGFTGKNTFFVNTWHGTPIKKMGFDLTVGNESFRSKNTWNMDVMTVQSRYEAAVFTRAFHLKQGICRILGLPRNDELARANEERKKECRQKIGIPEGKKVILYAPTFREYQKDEAMRCVFDTPIDWAVWEKKMGADYLVLLRAHYETIQTMQLSKDSGYVRDVSEYESLNELMIASDILISDYSSILFDYSILEQPMFCFTYDYDQYQSARGMYFDVRDWLPGGSVEQNELMDLILSMEDQTSYKNAVKMTRAFREKFVECCGDSTKKIVDVIAEGIRYEK